MHNVPPQKAFVCALKSIWEDLSPVAQQMLRAHYQCPGHRVTARDLAARVGFANHNAVNLHYGKLAGKLAAAMNWAHGKDINLWAIADFVRPKAEGNDEWVFPMRPELAAALEQLGKVRLRSQRTLRIVTWNCHCGPASKKLAAALSLEPDVLVAPEFPEPHLLIPGRMAWTGVTGGRNRRGILVYADREYRLRALRQPRKTDPQHFLGVEVEGLVRFNVLAVWAKPDSQSNAYVGSLLKALDLYERMFVPELTVVAGDLNSNALFSRAGRGHEQFVATLEERGLVSAYHAFKREAQGEESEATFQHMGSKHGAYHIDYCFIPKKWVGRLTSVVVGPVKGWRRFSDHAPLVVDINLG